MTALPIELPTAEQRSLDWERLTERFAWLHGLAGCPQDPVHHAEGDVWIHTKMVCEALVALPAWQALPVGERTVVLAAGLFHDIAKPATTRCDEAGRVTEDLQDPSGAYPSTTGATETAERLYSHSLTARTIGWVPR